jgi:hypothetical protein
MLGKLRFEKLMGLAVINRVGIATPKYIYQAGSKFIIKGCHRDNEKFAGVCLEDEEGELLHIDSLELAEKFL